MTLLGPTLGSALAAYTATKRYWRPLLDVKGKVREEYVAPEKDENKGVAIKNYPGAIITLPGLLPGSVSADMWPNILQQPHLLFD